MPQRFLRPGITSSQGWNSLDWIEQSFYIRIITLVDDHGRFEADPLLLKSLAFPLTEDIKKQQVSDMCEHLSASGLAIFYSNSGKKFLQLTKWKERIRSESKYPDYQHLTEEKSVSLTNDSKCLTSDSKCSPPKPEPLAISHKPKRQEVFTMNQLASKEVLDYLNQKTGGTLPYEPLILNHITFQLNKNHSVGDLKLVIDFMVKDWGKKPDFVKHLVPSILFKPGKFPEYLSSAKMAEKGLKPKIDPLEQNRLFAEKRRLEEQEVANRALKS